MTKLILNSKKKKTNNQVLSESLQKEAEKNEKTRQTISKIGDIIRSNDGPVLSKDKKKAILDLIEEDE